jgi:hypothetical protein
MSDFDPYHKWLGIPKTERPISKYRLLAIADCESDRDDISSAAEWQTVFLRTLQAGELHHTQQEVRQSKLDNVSFCFRLR